MSHIPLLRRDSYRDVPRLQPPKRGPQICACLLLVIIVGIVASGVGIPNINLFAFKEAKNVTLPLEAQRTRLLASSISSGARLSVPDLAASTLEDLVVAVGYILEQLSKAR